MRFVHHEIAEIVRDKLNLKEDKETKSWIEEYNKLKYTEKTDFILYMEKSQSLYIRYCMQHLINPISLLGLGSFYFKKARKDYYDIKKENPDLSDDEIVQLVKDNYWKRIKTSKEINEKNKTVKNNTKRRKSKEIVLSIKK